MHGTAGVLVAPTIYIHPVVGIQNDQLVFQFYSSGVMQPDAGCGTYYNYFLSEKSWLFCEFALATPIIFFSGRQLIKSGLVELRHLNPGMNSLVIIGASASYFYSLLVLIEPNLFPPGTDNSYFGASGIIIIDRSNLS